MFCCIFVSSNCRNSQNSVETRVLNLVKGLSTKQFNWLPPRILMPFRLRCLQADDRKSITKNPKDTQPSFQHSHHTSVINSIVKLYKQTTSKHIQNIQHADLRPQPILVNDPSSPSSPCSQRTNVRNK